MDIIFCGIIAIVDLGYMGKTGCVIRLQWSVFALGFKENCVFILDVIKSLIMSKICHF